jgi:hypothetical protein
VPQAAAVSVSVDAGADLASKLSKGPWWDVKDEYYVDDEIHPIPPLKQEGLASTPAREEISSGCLGMNET